MQSIYSHNVNSKFLVLTGGERSRDSHPVSKILYKTIHTNLDHSSTSFKSCYNTPPPPPSLSLI
ncbi:uncharacterized protein EI90DRAFT_3066396, partial [Cantharellus anzutake]|uniref:uncharacterized protein n=1 Tax=Cantharellus anzutake TaxID=1750568 RepID=UPI001903B04D